MNSRQRVLANEVLCEPIDEKRNVRVNFSHLPVAPPSRSRAYDSSEADKSYLTRDRKVLEIAL